MRALLDERLPRTLERSTVGHVAPDNRLPTLQPLLPPVQRLLDTITPGAVVAVLPPS